MVGLLGRVISPSQGLYLHRTTQHKKKRTNIHALSGIETHDPSNQPAKTHASDRTTTVTGIYVFWSFLSLTLMMEAKLGSKMLILNSTLTRLIDREDFITNVINFNEFPKY
jgi:hypothetical protein